METKEVINGLAIGLSVGLGVYEVGKWIDEKIQKKLLKKWIIKNLYEGGDLEAEFNKFAKFTKNLDSQIKKTELKKYSYEKLMKIKILICQFKILRNVEGIIQVIKTNGEKEK